jgi:hypothetical protein
VKSEVSEDFLRLFSKLPERIKKTARKNYRIWKRNPHHPGLDFKAVRGAKNT